MRILNVNMSLDPVTGGGTAERTFQVGRALSRSGAESTILTTDIGIDPLRQKTLGDVELIALPCMVKRFYIPAFSYQRIHSAVEHCDIIELMNHWTFINALVYLAARKLAKPYVVCPAGALQIYGRSKYLKIIFNRLIGKNIIRNASGHIAISSAEFSQFQQYGIPRDKVTLIPNGVNSADFKAENVSIKGKRFVPGRAPFILFMGRLNSIKGPDLLLEAFFSKHDRLADYHLVFAGPDDGMLDDLKTKAQAFEARDRIHFTGHLAGRDKAIAFQEADLLVIPSRQEAMSLVVLEAGITGTPVLLTDRCGFDQVQKIGGGKVVPATAEGLGSGLVEMLEASESLKTMGDNLRRYTLENFSWDSIIPKYLNLYQNILADENPDR